jgi:prevent-host-death family protein
VASGQISLYYPISTNWVFGMNIQVTASEFQQSFGEVSAKAAREPVTITRHGRPHLVVMAAEEWERLKRRDRKVGLVEDLPDEWIEAVRAAKVPDEYAHLDELME